MWCPFKCWRGLNTDFKGVTFSEHYKYFRNSSVFGVKRPTLCRRAVKWTNTLEYFKFEDFCLEKYRYSGHLNKTENTICTYPSTVFSGVKLFCTFFRRTVPYNFQSQREIIVLASVSGHHVTTDDICPPTIRHLETTITRPCSTRGLLTNIRFKAFIK